MRGFLGVVHSRSTDLAAAQWLRQRAGLNGLGDTGWPCCTECFHGYGVSFVGPPSSLSGTREMISRPKPEPTSPALTRVFKLKVTNEHPVGLLPLQKFWDISRQIHEFMTWTQVECPFEKDKKIQSYLLTAPIYSEEGEVHLCTL